MQSSVGTLDIFRKRAIERKDLEDMGYESINDFLLSDADWDISFLLP